MAVHFALATPTDEPALRQLLRDNPMPGAISLALTREPNFLLGATIEGETHTTGVAKEPQSGRVVAMASRSVRRAYLDGRVARVGYFCQLRIAREARGGSVLARGLQTMGAMHVDDPAEAYVTTIVADNLFARRILERERPSKPSYRPFGELHTLALVPRRAPRRRPPVGVTLRRGSRELLPDIAACLQRNYARLQFAPLWTADDLGDAERCRGLVASDFFVAERQGRIVGCVALWDQQAFKQSVVASYSRPLRLLRPLLNAAGTLWRLPVLPAVGAALPHAYLSHVAVDDDEAAVLLALADQALAASQERRLAYVTLGLATGHPLLAPVRRAYRHIDYRSIIYRMVWPGGPGDGPAPGPLVPHLEVATL